MATYDSYKDSGVKWLGQIPSHWEVKKLRAFFDRRNTKVSDTDYPPLSVTKNGIVPQMENVAKSKDSDNRRLVKINDFVINSRSDRKGSSGVSSLEGSVSFVNTIMTPRKAVIPSFCNYLLKSAAFIEENYRNGHGIVADLWTTSFDEQKLIKLAIPPLDEQDAIVAYLDKITGGIDRAIEAQRKMIEALNERKQIIITRAVTRGLNPDAPLRDSGIDWLGQIPVHWEIIPMRYLCKMKTGDKDTIMRDDNGAYPFFVRSPHVEHINTYTYDGEAVLMAGDGVGAGKVFHYINGKFDYHQRVYNFHKFNRIIGEFLYFYLLTNFRYKIEEGGAKSTVDSVRLPWLKAFPICVMPEKEQKEIVASIHQSVKPIDISLNNCERMISLLQERKQIIINEVVTGKKKVI